MRGFPDSGRALSGVWFTSFLFFSISLGENSEGEIWPAGHTEDGTSEGGGARVGACLSHLPAPRDPGGSRVGGTIFPVFFLYSFRGAV